MHFATHDHILQLFSLAVNLCLPIFVTKCCKPKSLAQLPNYEPSITLFSLSVNLYLISGQQQLNFLL